MVGGVSLLDSCLEAIHRETMSWRSGVRWAALAGRRVEGEDFRRFEGVGPLGKELRMEGGGEGKIGTGSTGEGFVIVKIARVGVLFGEMSRLLGMVDLEALEG